MPGYRTLTPTECKVLFEIWYLTPEMEQKGEPITAKTLAKALRMKGKRVQTVIREIQDISDDYIITSHYFPPNRRGKPGPPWDSYRLNRERLATVPESAFVLLELLKFPREKHELINRAAFVNHLVEECRLEESLVQVEINKAIETSYIDRMYEQQGYIAPGLRIQCENEYLQLVSNTLEIQMERKPPGREEPGSAQTQTGGT